MTHQADPNDTLRAALSAEDQKFLDEFDDHAGLIDLSLSVFKGRMRTLNIFAMIITFAMFALQVYTLIELLRASDPLIATRWLAGFIFATIATGLLKIWFWMRVNQMETAREIKRLELSILANRS